MRTLEFNVAESSSPTRSGSRELDARRLREVFQSTQGSRFGPPRSGPFWALLQRAHHTLAVSRWTCHTVPPARAISLGTLTTGSTTSHRGRWDEVVEQTTAYDNGGGETLRDVSSHDEPSATSSEEQSVGDEEHCPSPHR
jgi:hypothetical protein